MSQEEEEEEVAEIIPKKKIMNSPVHMPV